MAARSTFGDFASGAGRNLNALHLRPGQPLATREGLEEVTGAVLGTVVVLGRYVADVSRVFADVSAWEKRTLGPWARACIDTQRAIDRAAGLLRIHCASCLRGDGLVETRSPPAQQMAGVSALLTAGRDLLHTHFIPGADGARNLGAAGLSLRP